MKKLQQISQRLSQTVFELDIEYEDKREIGNGTGENKWDGGIQYSERSKMVKKS